MGEHDGHTINLGPVQVGGRGEKSPARDQLLDLALPFPAKDIDRFWSKVDRTEGCWQWTAGLSKNGYGTIKIQRLTRYAHRLSYELLVGPIPDGLTLDHLCRNRACVNPSHLEPVTRGENVLRGASPIAAQARTNLCKKGHAWTPENTMHDSGHRRCRKCWHAAWTARKAKARRA